MQVIQATLNASCPTVVGVLFEHYHVHDGCRRSHTRFRSASIRLATRSNARATDRSDRDYASTC